MIANQTIFAEGCRGSLSEKLISKFDLRKDCDNQIYGIGLKEIWEVKSPNFQAGTVQHTVGWPLTKDVYGGSFIYHMQQNLVHIGIVIGLDYKNPYLNPYEELQKLKKHKMISELLKDGTCISYGARAINEGGFYSIPKLTVPGGVLVGCGAGLLNVMKIKGTHNAMKSGMIAAENLFKKIVEDENRGAGIEIVEYENELKKSWVIKNRDLILNIL